MANQGFLGFSEPAGSILDNRGRLIVQHNGQQQGAEATVDFEDTASLAWTITEDGPNLRVQVAGTAAGGATPLFTAYILIEDQKASGTDGGSFNSGAWRQRDLNTLVADTGGFASVASNQFTLAPGAYLCDITCPAASVGRNQARLQNITDSATVGSGTSEYTSGSALDVTESRIVAWLIIAATKTFQVQHQCEASKATNGFGVASGGGFTVAHETYTRVQLWKQ